MSDTRTCKKCGETKPIDEFKRQGYKSKTCTACFKEARKAYVSKNKARFRKVEKLYRARNKKKISEANRRYCQENKEAINKKRRSAPEERKRRRRLVHRLWRKKNKEHCKEYAARYREANRERIRETNERCRRNNREKHLATQRRYKEIHRDRLRDVERKWKSKNKSKRNESLKILRQTDSNWRIRNNLSSRNRAVVREAFARLNRGERYMKLKTLESLGCTIEELKTQFESQFTEGMTWERFMSGEIHIDHIKPCASFDLTKVSEQRKCFHHTNLQPLWAKDNLRKNDKLDYQPLGIAA